MFKEMQELLGRTSVIMLTISQEGEKLRVNFVPKAKKDDDASVTPLTLVGTAEELDNEFSKAISTYTSKSQSIAEQMAEYEKAAEAARTAAAKKAEESAKNHQAKGSGKTTPANKGGESTGKAETPVENKEEDFDELFKI